MLEILIFFFGIYILIKGSVPSFLIGGPGYTIDKRGTHIIGLILLLPFPIYLLSFRLMTSLIGDQGRGISIIIDIVVIISVLTFALIFARRARISVSGDEPD